VATSTLREIDAQDLNFVPSGGHPTTLGDGPAFWFLRLAVEFLDQGTFLEMMLAKK
jgi:hypothetical protein